MCAVSWRVFVGMFEENLLLPSLPAPLQCLPHPPPLRLLLTVIVVHSLSISLYLSLYLSLSISISTSVMRAWTNVLGLCSYRCECSDSLEILSAPKLTELSVRASYDLSNLRLEDFAAATVEDVERMCAAEEKVRSATQAAIAEELSRWTSGEKGGEDAVRMGWCEQASDFDPDHVAVDSNGFLPGYDDGGGWEAELIGEYLETMVQRQYARSWETTRRQICDDLRQRSSSIMPRQDLPPCSLVTVNMELDVPSRAHFANHTLTGRIVDGNDEENEFF